MLSWYYVNYTSDISQFWTHHRWNDKFRISQFIFLMSVYSLPPGVSGSSADLSDDPAPLSDGLSLLADEPDVLLSPAASSSSDLSGKNYANVAYLKLKKCACTCSIH